MFAIVTSASLLGNIMFYHQLLFSFIFNVFVYLQNKRLQHELELEKSRASLGGKLLQSSDNSVISGNPGSDTFDGSSSRLLLSK